MIFLFLLGLLLTPTLLGLVARLTLFVYQKLWRWLNQRWGRSSELLLEQEALPDQDFPNYRGRLIWMGGLVIGAWLSKDHLIKLEDLTDLLRNLSQMLPRMMLGGFLSLCLGEIHACLYELEPTVRLKEYLASRPIIQKTGHFLAPLTQRINHCLNSVLTPIERAIQRISKRWLVLSLLAGVIFGCIFMYVTVYAIDAASYQQGQANADGLLAALETYQQATGQYPAALTDLVPQYLPLIPRPAPRHKYEYIACRQGNGYLLYYRLQGTAGKYCGYGDKLQTWQCVNISNARFYNSSCNVPKP